MSRRLGGLVAMAALSVVVVGCGGSSKKPVTTAGTSGTGSVSTRAASTAASGSASRTTTSRDKTSPTSTSGASNVRLPATFTIGSGGALSPPMITAPAGVPIELTAVSGDGKAHLVVLRSSPQRTLPVAAGGRETLVVVGLRAGRYALVVDGAARGTLVVGGAPGP